jgi:hypothetical protein
VSVTELSDAVNAGMVKQTEGRRLALSRKSPPSVSSLVSWLVGSTHIELRNYMGLSSQLNAPTLNPLERIPVSVNRRLVWLPEPMWIIWRREKCLTLRDSNLGSSSP